MKHNIDWEKLARYFAGELTREEHQKMKTWIEADSRRERYVQGLHKIWKESGFSSNKVDVDEAWDRLSAKMDELELQEEGFGQLLSDEHDIRTGDEALSTHKTIRNAGRTIRRVTLTAAAAAIMLIAGFFTYQYDLKLEAPSEEVGFRQLVADDGERAIYILNDSSRVILHAGSRLAVPLGFNIDSRELYLEEGEAYFEVTHNPEKPFIVRSENGYTRVLGTKFLVQAWGGAERSVEVVVAEGRVALGDNNVANTTGSREVVITENQRGTLTGDKDLVVTNEVDLDWYLGWTEGHLAFNNRPFSEIIPKLERWYVLDIQTENETIAAKRLTAEIDYSQPMTEVLKGIALSLDLEFEKDGRTVTFRSRL